MMNYIIGILFVVAGGGLLSGNKIACYVLWPEAFLWKTILKIEVGPYYRKAQGVCLLLAGFLALFFDILVKALV